MNYIVTFDHNKMTLEFPLDCEFHQLWGHKNIQMYLNKGWILDGEIFTDYVNRKIVCKLKRLEGEQFIFTEQKLLTNCTEV